MKQIRREMFVILAAFLALLVLTLASCGGDEGDNNSTFQPTDPNSVSVGDNSGYVIPSFEPYTSDQRC